MDRTARPDPGGSHHLSGRPATARSVFLFNKGPGTIHLHLGTPSTSWESSPESARRLKPGESAESTPESSKASLSGWSEEDTADLLVDILS